jgi:hypothetical protein
VIEPRPVEFYEPAEAFALYAAIERLPGPKWRTLAELGMDVGLRPGEIFGLHDHRVDFLRGRLTVVDVMTRQGLRQWPKSKKSHRTVPVPPHVLEGMSVLMAGRVRDAIVFSAPQGGPVTDEHFRDRVWYPAVTAARLCGREPAGDGAGSAGRVRRPAALHPPVRAADHATQGGLMARPGRGSAVRRPGAARSRGLRHDAAVRQSTWRPMPTTR